jgi:hypothetical protein
MKGHVAPTVEVTNFCPVEICLYVLQFDDLYLQPYL